MFYTENKLRKTVQSLKLDCLSNYITQLLVDGSQQLGTCIISGLVIHTVLFFQQNSGSKALNKQDKEEKKDFKVELLTERFRGLTEGLLEAE